jgi:hypothetical protein
VCCFDTTSGCDCRRRRDNRCDRSSSHACSRVEALANGQSRRYGLLAGFHDCPLSGGRRVAGSFLYLFANFQVNTYNVFDSVHGRLGHSALPRIWIRGPCFQHPRCSPVIELHLATRDAPKHLLRINPTIDLDIDCRVRRPQVERPRRWRRTVTMYAGLVHQYVLKPRHGVP